MSTTTQQVVDYVFGIAPNPSFGTENIYEFGGGEPAVNGIGVAWWITSEMLEDFAKRGINLGLTHERVIYDVPESYEWGTPCRAEDLVANRRIAELCEQHGIVIHRFHSNLDVADWAMPHALLKDLGWSDFKSDWSRGIPVIEHPPVKLGALIEEIKARMQLPFVRYDGDVDRVVSRIALAWGGVCQWWTGACCASPLGFDVVLGGDIIDGVVRLAREQGWAVIDAFHHATEMPGMRALVTKLEERFPGVPVHYYENLMPWSVG